MGDLWLGIAVRSGDQERPVTIRHSRLWAVDLRTLLTTAFENSRSSAGRIRFRNLGSGTFHGRHPDLAAWSLRTPLIAERLEVAGPAVMLIPTADSVLVTGSQNRAGLVQILHTAAALIREHPADVVSTRPLIRRTGWETFQWPAPTRSGRLGRHRPDPIIEADDRLPEEFDLACARLPLSTPVAAPATRSGVRPGPGPSAAWARLSGALGLDAAGAHCVQAAADDELGPVAVLGRLLRQQGRLIVVNRKTDPALIAQDVANSPPARVRRLTPTLDAEYDRVVDLAEAISAALTGSGVGALALGDAGEDIDLVIYPVDNTAEISAAVEQIGDPLLICWL